MAHQRWQLQLLLLVAAAAVAAAAEKCSTGDSACWCAAIGGQWMPARAPALVASCQLNYQHAGRSRYVRAFLPSSFDGTKRFPIWVHVHGVFWSTMGDIGERVGGEVQGTEIIPAWDHAAELMGDKAIIVYPQSLGDPGRGTADEGQGKKFRQFWTIPFWRCSVGICSDPKADDIGFLEKVIADLPQRLADTAVPGQLLLSGESAGGMMINTLLCQSRTVPRAITAAVDILGGIGADFAATCKLAPPVPYLKLHGMEDPSITYAKRILVDAVEFLSAIELGELRGRANGCTAADKGPVDVPEGDGKMLCTDFCGAAAGSKLPAKVCGMPGVGHDTDHPFPGFAYLQAWKFFTEQGAAAKPKPAKRPASAAAPRPAAAAVLAGESEGPLTLNITFPGFTLSVFKAQLAGKELAAVADATGLPAANITARYFDVDQAAAAAPAGRQHRRALAAAAAAAEPAAGGVLASYQLAAGQASDVVQSVSAALDNGSLLAKLQEQGLVSRGGAAPVVGLASAASGEALIEPVDMAEAARAAAAAPASSSGAAAPAAAAPAQQPAAGAAGAAAPSSSAAAPSSSTGAIVGGVVGGVAGAALLAGAAVWAATAAKRRKQQRAAAAATAAAAQQKQSQQAPGVINLTAATAAGGCSDDAVMFVSDK